METGPATAINSALSQRRLPLFLQKFAHLSYRRQRPADLRSPLLNGIRIHGRSVSSL
jgi:hypothetical protein